MSTVWSEHQCKLSDQTSVSSCCSSKRVFIGEDIDYLTFSPLYVQLPNFMSQSWSSNGNHVISIKHVDLKIPKTIYLKAVACNVDDHLEECRCRLHGWWPRCWWGRFHQMIHWRCCTSECPEPRWEREESWYLQCSRTLTHSSADYHPPIPKH